jgi:hypothetical protein
MMATKIKNANITKVDLVTKGANPGAKILLYKSFEEKQGGNNVKEFIDSLKAQDETVEIGKKLDELYAVELQEKEDIAKKLEVANASIEEINKAKEAEKTEEDIMKGLSDEAISIFKSLKVRLDASENLAKKLADERDIEKFDNISKSLNIGEVLEVSKVLREVNNKCSKETYELLEKTLKASKAQIEKGELFSEKGTSRESDVSDWKAVEQKALAKMATVEGLSNEQKIEKWLSTEEGQLEYEKFCKGDK